MFLVSCALAGAWFLFNSLFVLLFTLFTTFVGLTGSYTEDEPKSLAPFVSTH